MKLVRHGRGSYSCPLCGVRLRPVRLEHGVDVRQCPGCGRTARVPKRPDFCRGKGGARGPRRGDQEGGEPSG